MRIPAALLAIILATSGCQFAIGALSPIADDSGDAGLPGDDLSAAADGSPAPKDGPLGMPDATTTGCTGDPECQAAHGGDGAWKCCNAACMDTSSDPMHCGSCTVACAAGMNQTATCAMSACQVKCTAGFADCDGDLANGCEVDLGSDKNNCGACNNQCAGVCGSAIIADMKTQPGGWNFNGSKQATYWDKNSQSAVLVDNQGFTAGSILYQNAIVTDSFDARFDFQMGGGNGADGMGFMIETDGNNRTGNNANGLGIANLTGYGVEFDEFNNMSCGDNDNNHIGVDSLKTCQGSAPTALSPTVMPGFMLHGSGYHSCTIHFDMGKVTVSLDGTKLIDAYQIQNFQSKSYYYGFGAATGGATDRFEVKNVEIDFPSPRCL
jgi:hypothetical protein